MLQKKVCLLGSFAVGKTSLVRRYVDGLFSEKYQTTVGVKVDQRQIEVAGTPMKILLWDMHGDDEFQRVRISYLRGASGCILVADQTRPPTLERALSLRDTVASVVGPVPCILTLNKSDLVTESRLDAELLQEWREQGGSLFETSARDGSNVEQMFLDLGQQMLPADR